MHRLVGITVAFAVCLGCAVDDQDAPDACDRLADYYCDCHGEEDPDGCDGFLALAEQPSSDEIDQCVIDLQTYKDDDEADGVECATT